MTDLDLKGVSEPMQAATLALDLGADLSAAGVYGAATHVEALPGSSLAGMAALAGAPEIFLNDSVSLSQPMEQDGDISVIGVGGVDALTITDATAPANISDDLALLLEIPLVASPPQSESAFSGQFKAEERVEGDGDQRQVAESPLDALRKSLKSVKETREMFEAKPRDKKP